MDHTRLLRNIFKLVVILMLFTGCSNTRSMPELPNTALPTRLSANSTDQETPVPVTVSFPLSETGTHFPGKRRATFEFAGSEHKMTLWYPSIKPQGFSGTVASAAEADYSGAPYPLLLTATTFGNYIAPHLASHGFVVAGVDEQEPYRQWDMWIIEYPMQELAMLDQMTVKPEAGLEGLYDPNNSGVLGYSFSGYTALALSGARLDPRFYLDKCARGPVEGSSPSETMLNERVNKYFCHPAANWDTFLAQAGNHITVSKDGLWQAITDSRIRATMPMAVEGTILFGERGLAAIDRPVLMICGTEDANETDYRSETVYIYEHLGTKDKTLISFIGGNHMMVFEPEPFAQIRHFATAFFGYHLQGQQDYAKYFSKEFVQQFSDLAWGVYQED